MNKPSQRPAVEPDYERQLREMNDALLISSVRQHELTEQAQRAETALRASEEQFRRAIEDAPIPVIMHAEDGEVLQVSRSWTELTGYSIEDESVIRNWLTTAYGQGGDDVRAAVKRLFASGDAMRGVEFEVVTRRGERRVWSFSASSPGALRDGRRFVVGMAEDITQRKEAEQGLRRATGLLAKSNEELERRVAERTIQLEHTNTALLRDIDERKKLEEQLRRAQLMESIGTLAGGIAHDFNNILNIIHGYASAICGASDDEITESVEAINAMTDRGANLVRQLLTLARKQEPKMEPIDVNSSIHKLRSLLNETFPRNIEVRLDLNRDLCRIMADPNQFNQVLLNLCMNARDAMPRGGRLALKTRIVDGTILPNEDKAIADRYVAIEVVDTGTGMDESVRSRIFEPFFTTKEASKGSGLGLSVVYGIVKKHDACIQVQSAPARGTTFSLYFPAVTKQ